MGPFPKNKFELKYSNLAPDVIRNLQALKRTGWVNRGVKNGESIQEHIIATRNLIISEINSLTEFSSRELEELLDMLEIHDWAESDAIVGDSVILKTNVNIDDLKKEKYELELSAMTKICERLGDKGKIILALWMKFENGQDPVSSLARQVDKYQAMEKAFEYEQDGENVSTQEFIEHDKEKIIHPILVRKLQALKQKLA